MPTHVLALVPPLGGTVTVVDADAPQLSVLDLGATRGDGIFETFSVFHGAAQALEPHLQRFGRSATLLDLAMPDLPTWRAAVRLVIAELALAEGEEAWVKIVYTRGIEGGSEPTGWAYATRSGDMAHYREQGIRVVTLDRGYRHDVAQTSPWLLQGAKSLSYAVNRAVFREAERREADDVIFTSSDGYVLEGPTSTVVYRRGSTLFTPGPDLGILDGTTQENVFRFAESRGMSTALALPTLADLVAADSLWLVSSVRLVAPVRQLDGVERQFDREFTAELNEWLRLVAP